MTGQLVHGSVPDERATRCMRALTSCAGRATFRLVSDRTCRRLRGTTLAAAPLFMVGVIGATVAVATTLWAAWHPDDLGVAFAATLGGAAILAVGGFVGARGCFVEVGAEEVRDVVAWRTRWRAPRTSVVEARVLAGPWRWFEVELDDASLVTLVGASPVQFPARLLPGAREQDLADLALLRGG